MNAQLLSKVNELDIILHECMLPWHGEHSIEIKTRLELQVMDNSADTVEAYRPGGIAQVVKPVMYVEYYCWQSEENEHIIPLPENIWGMKVDLDTMHIDFHIKALTEKYLKGAPSIADWEAAEDEGKRAMELAIKEQKEMAF